MVIYLIYIACAQLLCPTLSGPVDCSLPGSSVHGIFQATTLDGLPFLPGSSILAWKIPWTEEPGGPQSKGLQGVGHN